MTNEIMTFPLAQNDLPAKNRLDGKAFQSTGTLWQTGAILCFAISFLSLVSGFLLLFVAWFANSQLSGVLAKWAFIAPIPLTMLGAHCLDKLEFIEKAARKKWLDN